MPKIVRAIVIDPQARSVEYRDIADSLPAFYEAVGSTFIDWCYPFSPALRECLWCAEWRTDPPSGPHFRIAGFQWPIYGKALLVGFGAAGETRDIKLSVEELYAQIDFD